MLCNECLPEHWRFWKRREEAEKKNGKEEGKSIEGEHVLHERQKKEFYDSHMPFICCFFLSIVQTNGLLRAALESPHGELELCFRER